MIESRAMRKTPHIDDLTGFGCLAAVSLILGTPSALIGWYVGGHAAYSLTAEVSQTFFAERLAGAVAGTPGAFVGGFLGSLGIAFLAMQIDQFWTQKILRKRWSANHRSLRTQVLSVFSLLLGAIAGGLLGVSVAGGGAALLVSGARLWLGSLVALGVSVVVCAAVIVAGWVAVSDYTNWNHRHAGGAPDSEH